MVVNERSGVDRRRYGLGLPTDTEKLPPQTFLVDSVYGPYVGCYSKVHVSAAYSNVGLQHYKVKYLLHRIAAHH